MRRCWSLENWRTGIVIGRVWCRGRFYLAHRKRGVTAAQRINENEEINNQTITEADIDAQTCFVDEKVRSVELDAAAFGTMLMNRSRSRHQASVVNGIAIRDEVR